MGGSYEERQLPSLAEKISLKGDIGPISGDSDSRALVGEGWKLLRHPQPPEAAPRFKLFDHRMDPLDALDVAAEQTDVVERPRSELES